MEEKCHQWMQTVVKTLTIGAVWVCSVCKDLSVQRLRTLWYCKFNENSVEIIVFFILLHFTDDDDDVGHTLKVLNFQKLHNLAVITLKLIQRCLSTVIRPKGADRMAKSVHPDPLGAVCSLICVCTFCSG